MIAGSDGSEHQMSEDIPFKVGDVVVLKRDARSAGRKDHVIAIMTVASINGNTVTCDWSVRGDIKSKSFAVAQLTTDVPSYMTLGQLIEAASVHRDEQV